MGNSGKQNAVKQANARFRVSELWCVTAITRGWHDFCAGGGAEKFPGGSMLIRATPPTSSPPPKKSASPRKHAYRHWRQLACRLIRRVRAFWCVLVAAQEEFNEQRARGLS